MLRRPLGLCRPLGSCPASVSGGTVYLKVLTKYRTLKEKIKMPPEITHMLTIFAEHGMIADIP